MEAAKPAEPKEELVKTQHSVSINGQKVDYTAIAGTILLRDNEDKPTATIFHIAYTKDNVQDLAQRPVACFFNGGLGSASVHSVESDLNSAADSIRLCTTRISHWGSPKFTIGESYGTTRAAGLSDVLRERQRMNVNGIPLVSTGCPYPGKRV